MRKLLFSFCLVLCGALVTTLAQESDRSIAREAEWKGYQVPEANFVRQTAKEKNFIFRVPAEWKKEGDSLVFQGPHSAKIKVIVETIPDGLPLPDYVAAIMRLVDGMAGSGEVLSRRTQFQDLEARELVIESENAEGETIRSTSWTTVVGPLAVTFNLQTPQSHAPEVEPYFKAVVQSVSFVNTMRLESFETDRSGISLDSPAPVKELQEIVALLNEPKTNRSPLVDRLAALFKSTPHVPLDLLLDRRALVRAAAVEALAKTDNKAFRPFLWDALDDSELIVAEPAARKLAQATGIPSELFAHSMSGFETGLIARVWPFVPREKQIEILEAGFSQPAIAPATTPPPPIRKLKPGVSVTVTQLERVKPGQVKGLDAAIASRDPNVQLGLLSLLVDVPIEDFKLPLSQLISAKYDPLVIVGLQIANERLEQLPIEPLLKLAESQSDKVRKLAVQSLALTASVADIPHLEGLAAKATKEDQGAIKTSIEKIRLRDQLESAKRSGKPQIEVIKSISDKELANFAWQWANAGVLQKSRRVYSSEANKLDLAVRPFAENLFPAQVIHYGAVPNPGEAIEKLYNSLRSIQMASPRAQSNLILTMGGFRQILGQQLNAPTDATALIDYTGIKSDSPIAFAEWLATGAKPGNINAKRKAVVLKVTDRQRLERVVETFQDTTGNFTDLINYVAAGSRAMAALPAILPLAAKQILVRRESKPTSTSLLKYSRVGHLNFKGLDIKILTSRRIDSDWIVTTNETYIAFLGDVAVISPNFATISELLSDPIVGSNHLAENDSFQRVRDEGGDVIYFSDVRSALALFGEPPSDMTSKLSERGALTISNGSWDTSHRFEFGESDWAKNLQQFQPKDLIAPSELLPPSTIAYYFMKPDLGKIWLELSKTLFNKEEMESLNAIWSADFKNDFVSELGPECGAALLDLPDFEKFDDVSLTVFCKLKSNKISDALKSGQLFRGIGPTTEVAEVKVEKQTLFIGVRNGFLIVSNKRDGVTLLDQKPGLASTRDYSKAAEKVPGSVIAFGGYNLEASVAAASKGATIDGLNAQIANVIFSLASAFHSQSFFASGTTGSIEAKSSVSMDREGRYAVSDFSFLPHGQNVTYFTLEPRGVPIVDQQRLSDLALRIRSKSAGPIDSIKDDISSEHQIVKQAGPKELVVTVSPRRVAVDKKIDLPITNPELSQFLKASNEISSDDKNVINQAKQIAGKEKDAWTVARKLSEWTFKNLTWKSVAVANASQTLATREADCSEFSQLYVSMARSLGLPARIVSGLAYGGSSFGGHAWVEVWVGRWIELDPTWGTDFVDATHIRNSSGTLVTSAGLNLIELEVVEAKRTVADYQQSARALAQHVSRALAQGDRSGVESALDLSVVTDELMGAGSWSQLSSAERAQMSSGYKRALYEIVLGYRKDYDDEKVRFFKVVENGDRADGLCFSANGDLLKLRLAKRNNSWQLIDIVESSTGLHVVAESLSPAIKWIKETRAGQKTKSAGTSPFVRTLLLKNSNPNKALEIVDAALKDNPTRQELRFLKSHVLFALEKKAEAIGLLRELGNEDPAYPAAIYDLAQALVRTEEGKENSDAEKKEILGLYKRYTELEPFDPTGHTSLAGAYEGLKELELARSEYQAALDCDPDLEDRYFNLVYFFVSNGRTAEVGPVFELADRHPEAGEDIFGVVVESLYYIDEYNAVEALATSQPKRLQKSVRANIALGRTFIDNQKPLKALPPLNLALQLDKKSTDAYVALAEANRGLWRWAVALKATDEALKLDYESAEAHYQRACVLARLGKKGEAMFELSKSIDLESWRIGFFNKEEDLGSLSSLPAYKKLEEKQKKEKEEK